jgi:hypothetical protein
MPETESMFKYHGYSGDCPKPPMVKDAAMTNKSELPDCMTCNNKMYYPPEDKFICMQKCENGSLYNPCQPIQLYTITTEAAPPDGEPHQPYQCEQCLKYYGDVESALDCCDAAVICNTTTTERR